MMTFTQARWNEPIIFELSSNKEKTGIIQTSKTTEKQLEETRKALGKIFRENLEIPNLSEIEVVRHFTRLTQMSFGVDNGPVPLGSCTMKYNPRLATRLLSEEKIQNLHPILLETQKAQGVLELLYRLQSWFEKITGMEKCSLQPPAGASGEFSGILMIKKYFYEKNMIGKKEILVPDSAHGTNPASASMGGFKVVRIPTNDDGLIDLEALKASLTPETAGFMITNPNTLGLFEEKILEISQLLKENNTLMYYDGANLNGILGIARPGDMGFDIVHLNIHKTFSAPHGAGGPGAGVVCSKGDLIDYLPGYLITEKNGEYKIEKPRKSIGEVSSFYTNLPAMIYAMVFLLSHGEKGLPAIAVNSSLLTNLFLQDIKNTRGIEIPYSPEKPRYHEAVISVKKLTQETGVTAEDIAKYLLDHGLHAPTIYFPPIVEEALMIEFTETETIENVEYYAQAFKKAVQKAYEDPSEQKNRPKHTSVGRLDGVRANHPATMTPTYKVKKLREKGLLK